MRNHDSKFFYYVAIFRFDSAGEFLVDCGFVSDRFDIERAHYTYLNDNTVAYRLIRLPNPGVNLPDGLETIFLHNLMNTGKVDLPNGTEFIGPMFINFTDFKQYSLTMLTLLGD